MESVPPLPLPDETAVDYSLLGSGQAERGRKLFLTGLALLGVVLIYLTRNANVQSLLHLYQGLTIMTLSIVPSLIWARSGGSRFPVFEPIMGLCANAYGMPLLNGQEQLAAYAPDVVSRAGWVVIIYQLSGILMYTAIRGQPGRSRFWREPIVTQQIEKLIVYGLGASTLYVGISTFTTWIPSQYESALRAVFYGIGILSTFVSTQRWGRGEMTQGEKALFLCTFVPQLIFMSVGLLLIGAFSLIGIALLGFLSGGKRIPWVFIALTFGSLAVLHTGKTRMREKYWEHNLPAPTITELPAYFSEWVEFGLQPTSGDKTVSQKMIERTSLMHILCLIAEYSPARQDYLYGKTYGYVLPQLIPRVFWPDKPRSHIATYELAIYYGLQNEEDTNSTTIAFGLLTEAYANFGLYGAIMLGMFWGFFLKKLQIWTTFSPMFSFAGLMMILLTAWSLSAELTMAAWVSSLEQALLVVIGLPMLIRSLLGH